MYVYMCVFVCNECIHLNVHQLEIIVDMID